MHAGNARKDGWGREIPLFVFETICKFCGAAAACTEHCWCCCFGQAAAQQVQLLGSDSIMGEVLKAAAILETQHGIGATVSLAEVAGGDAFVALFSESTARAIVTTADPAALEALASEHGVPLTRLGETGGDALSVEGQFDVPVTEAKAAWQATLPDALG